MWRSGREFQIDWPNRQIIILLLIGMFVLTTANAVGLAGLMGAPPIAIEVRAEPIGASISTIPCANDLVRLFAAMFTAGFMLGYITEERG
jgi:hypothetical protein